MVVQIGQGYPHEAPKVKCETMLYHPNIDLEGNVCLNILRYETCSMIDYEVNSTNCPVGQCMIHVWFQRLLVPVPPTLMFVHDWQGSLFLCWFKFCSTIRPMLSDRQSRRAPLVALYEHSTMLQGVLELTAGNNISSENDRWYYRNSFHACEPTRRRVIGNVSGTQADCLQFFCLYMLLRGRIAFGACVHIECNVFTAGVNRCFMQLSQQAGSNQICVDDVRPDCTGCPRITIALLRPERVVRVDWIW